MSEPKVSKLFALPSCSCGSMRDRFFMSVLLLSISASGQTALMKGTVQERDGAKLPQAHILIKPDSLFLATDAQGRFETRLPVGIKTLLVSYVGYKSTTQTFRLKSDTIVSFLLEPDASQLNEVVVSSNRYSSEDLLNSTQSSVHVVTLEEVESIPVLGGEADVIKTLQLLPGVLRGVEGSSDLFVRGGSADQNMVMLDNVPIYNTSHLMGFVSVFNPDVLSQVEAMNGGFPARYGGRLSSILNVQTVSDIPNQTRLSADVGMIASRVSVAQPLIKNKLAIHVAGRRTYIDQVAKLIDRDLPYYFYDLNAKLVYKPTLNDEVNFSYYGGEDVLSIFRDRNGDGDGNLTTFDSGNNSQSIQWRHGNQNSLRQTNISFFRSSYQYNVLNAFEDNKLAAISDILDYGASVKWISDSLRSGQLKFGVDWTQHRVSPSVISTSGFIAELVESSASRGRLMHEGGVYGEYEFNQGARWTINVGLRTSFAITEDKNYFYPEPRLSGRYAINKQQSLKLSYSRMAQYLHRIANSAITSPTDIWYPVTGTIKPQTGHQWAVAWQTFRPQQKIYISLESYFKTMNNLIGFEEGTNLFLNTDFASQLIAGKGRAYGVEALLKKETGKLSGWISYTLSWSSRQFDELNQGDWFYSRYDRRHNGAVVVQYRFHPRWAISGVFEYISGSRFTPVVGQYLVFAPSMTGGELIPIFTGINNVKLSDTHRLDLGLKFKSKTDKRIQWEVFAGVYNAYNRANPIGITIEQDEQTGALKYLQPGLFGVIPFISVGIKY
jgi:outer membrane cobalamin receptor